MFYDQLREKTNTTEFMIFSLGKSGSVEDSIADHIGWQKKNIADIITDQPQSLYD